MSDRNLALRQRLSALRCECGHTPAQHMQTAHAWGMLAQPTNDCTAWECPCQVYRERGW